jgi:hypothetical protein
MPVRFFPEPTLNLEFLRFPCEVCEPIPVRPGHFASALGHEACTYCSGYVGRVGWHSAVYTRMNPDAYARAIGADDVGRED